MPNTNKPGSKLDYEQTLQKSYNDVNSTLSVDGFLVGKVGHRVELAITGGDTIETYTFKDGSTVLYIIQVVYTDSSRTTMSSATRIA